MIKDWPKIRIGLLAGTFGSIVFAVIFSLIDVSVAKKSPAWEMPVKPNVLSGWQLTSSENITIQPREYVGLALGRRYQYMRKARKLNIETRYIKGGNVDNIYLLKIYSTVKPPHKIKVINQPNIGYHGLFVDNEQAYLTACINVRGGSTVTQEQFAYNRQTYDLHFSRLLPWLLGLNDLRDWRCIWVMMSTPLEGRAPDEAFSTLSTVWSEWQQWWLPQFPKN